MTYGVILNLSRGLATDPLSVRFSGVSTDRWRGAVAQASSTALLIGVVTGTLSVVAGLVIGAETARWADEFGVRERR